MDKTVLTLPYLYEPRDYQIPFLEALDSGKKRAIWVVHRRGGKDKTAWNYTVRRAWEEKGTYFYLLPTYNQARKVIWDGIDKDGVRFLDHVPKQILKKKPNDTEMQIELKNGSIIQLIGADNVDRIVGTNPRGVVFSEYSLMKPEVWDYLRPILVENGGWAIFIFTPRGLNHAWKLLQDARNSPDIWFSQVLTVRDTKAISEFELEEERKTSAEALYNQEYLCEFTEGAGAVFRRVEKNVWDGHMEPEYGYDYQLGVDLAKYNDWTVITPLNRNTGHVGIPIRFNQIDWNLQKARIENESLRFNHAQILMDSTGLGDPILDDLSLRGLSVEGYKFTEKSKKDLLNNLAVLLEQDRIKIPNDPVLIDELKGMQYVLNEETGKTKIESATQHDDMVMSLALAVWGFKEAYGRPKKGREEVYGIYADQSFN